MLARVMVKNGNWFFNTNKQTSDYYQLSVKMRGRIRGKKNFRTHVKEWNL